MAVKLVVEKYCDNCPDFEAHVDKNETLFTDMGLIAPCVQIRTVITCEHRARCRCQMEYLADQKT